jgi:hypothetical protein
MRQGQFTLALQILPDIKHCLAALLARLFFVTVAQVEQCF